MWMSDPGCEPIIIEKLEMKTYCFNCRKEMLKHGHAFECPICGNIANDTNF